jgi:glycosyltransferase involved in cell wall biosynthesis
MKILDVIQSMHPKNGGPCQGIRNLDESLRNLGVAREVVCLDSPDSPYLTHDKIQIHAIGKGVSPLHYNSRLVPWLTTNIGRFDVIIINGLWSYHSYATWKVLHNFKVKNQGLKSPLLFVMPHGMLDPYFQKAKGRKLKALRNYVYWDLIEKKVVNNADGLLFTCETEMLLARGTFKHYHPKKEFNVGFGIEPPLAYDQNMTIAFKNSCAGLGGSPYLLFLGRIDKKKGVELLIKAYISLRKFKGFLNGPIPKLVIAGPGVNTRYGKKVKAELDKFPEMKSEIFFPGMLVDEAKWGAFYGCEAFILPSHQENFGIALVEALACRKPVLISNQVNIYQEVIISGSGIVEEDTLRGVQKMLINWFDLTEIERVEMSNKAFIAFNTFFNISRIAGNFLKVFANENR